MARSLVCILEPSFYLVTGPFSVLCLPHSCDSLLHCAQFSDRSEIQTKALKRTRNTHHIKMSKIFSWEYLSFVTLDDTIAYKVKLY